LGNSSRRARKKAYLTADGSDIVRYDDERHDLIVAIPAQYLIYCIREKDVALAHSHDFGKAENDTMALLSGVELFSTLLEDDLAYVNSRTGSRSFPENTVLFSAGEKALHFYIVKTGSVSIYSVTQDSIPVELARYEAGDVFGDFHFVIGDSYNATARTLENSELLVFPDEGFTLDRISDEKPDTASRILLRSITMIESRIRSTGRLIEENVPWVRELRKQIFIDPPTGLWNKAFMDTELAPVLPGTVATIMVKPDCFKEVNDRLGHAAGDDILRGIAALLIGEAARFAKGWAVRLRSNEMCLILCECDARRARSVAQEVRAAFSGLIGAEYGSERIVLTASVAFGLWLGNGGTWRHVAERANELLQEVWKSGGNLIAQLDEAGN